MTQRYLRALDLHEGPWPAGASAGSRNGSGAIAILGAGLRGPATASWDRAGSQPSAGTETVLPTTFGVIAMVLVVVGAIAGLVIWGRQVASRIGSPQRRGSHPDAPVDENTAAALNARSADRNNLS